MTTATQTYNGWTNYETWNAKLWMDNDEGSYRYWQEIAQECWDDAGAGLNADPSFTQQELAAFNLSDRLKSEFEESMPELGASFWADILGAALSEVNWHEIAEHLIEDVNKTDSE